MFVRALLFAGVLCAGLFIHAPAQGHLSIIRQGLESRGAKEAGDHHGHALAAGDFNGDGFDDLAMGAPYEHVGTVADAGAVIVEWGGPYGLDPAGAELWTEDEATSGGGVSTNGYFGYALVAADFNGDGIDDLAVGSPGYDGSVGIVYVLRGSATGLVRWHDLLQSNAGGALEAGDRFGASLASGNFDGDPQPYADLAVGAPGENSDAGAVFWFLGNAVGPVGTSGFFRQTELGLTPAAGDQFGYSLAAGNFLSTSHDDLAVGAPFKQVGSTAGAGLVCQIAGSAAGLIAGGYGALNALNVDALQADARYGFALAVGHLENNSGGYASLVVGEPFRDFSSILDAGRVIVYEGAASGVSLTGEIVLTQVDAGSTVSSHDQFGSHLAAGRFWDPADGWDDLAVGSPGDGLGAFSFTGQVNIFHGGTSGPGSHGWSGFNQATLNDPIENNENLGYSPVFGRFDGTGFGHLAVGAPGEDAGAGMVHIIAPWRQTYGLSARHSVVYDCDDELYFSVKPYDRVYIASTTKVLTVLIACEWAQAGNVALTDEYIVPDWVAFDVPGSQVPLWPGEKINFWDLMNVCIHRSGNDAANALADWMAGGGGPWISLPIYMARMNTRAAQIGMANSHFNNANGFDTELVGPELGEHYSTPVDMGLLCQVAMQNPMFRDIVDQTTFTMVRQIPLPGMPNTFFTMPFSEPTFYRGIILNGIQPAIGIKGGLTPLAQVTGCFAAETSLGDIWVAGSYFTMESAPWGNFRDDAGNLLLLGGQSPACGFTIFPIEIVPQICRWFGLSAALGDTVGGAAEIGWGPDENVVVEIGPHHAGADGAEARVELRRISQVLIPFGEEVPYGVGTFQGHGPITLLHSGDEDVTVEVHRSYAAEPLIMELMPGVPDTIPPFDPIDPPPDFDLLIMNVSAGDAEAYLTVEEVYPFDVAFTPRSSAPLEVPLERFTGGSTHDSFSFMVVGQSSDPEAEIYLAVHPLGHDVSAVRDPAPGDGPLPVLRVAPSYPNPFGTETRAHFDLHRSATVGVTIYDIRGRVVRRFAEAPYLPGRHQVMWDGRDDQGLRAADGVYLMRIDADGKMASLGKVTLVK